MKLTVAIVKGIRKRSLATLNSSNLQQRGHLAIGRP